MNPTSVRALMALCTVYAKSKQYQSSGLQRQMKPTLVRALVALFTSGKVIAPYSSPLEGVATGTAALKCRHRQKIADIGDDEAPRGPMTCILAWLHLDTRNQAYFPAIVTNSEAPTQLTSYLTSNATTTKMTSDYDAA